MKSRILALNVLFINNEIDLATYKAMAEKILRTLDWQRRIQYENLLFA